MIRSGSCRACVLGKSVSYDDCLRKDYLTEVLKMKKVTRVKMSNEELQEYLIFKHRHSTVEPKKGKGATYKRSRDLKAFN